jgi:hypothetical protein
MQGIVNKVALIKVAGKVNTAGAEGAEHYYGRVDLRSSPPRTIWQAGNPCGREACPPIWPIQKFKIQPFIV